MTHAFELHRHKDGLVYRFARDRAGVYRRADNAALTIQWDPGFGWIALDPKTADVAGMVWGVPAHAQGGCPPEGLWVSCKGQKSYVYDLRHLSDPKRKQSNQEEARWRSEQQAVRTWRPSMPYCPAPIPSC